jgi:cobalt-zinc-cadmium efflux system outer membrane protein
MSPTRLLLLSSLLLLGGCLWPVREKTDRMVTDLAGHPFDLAPPESVEDKPKTEAPAEKASATEAKAAPSEPAADVQTVALLQAEKPEKKLPKYELTIPPGVPGSEAPLLPRLDKMTPEQKERTIRQLYPELPPLPDEPTALPGPDGRPYTLADLQKLAVENSPTLRQAASDV